MNINNVKEIILNSDEETTQFLSVLQLHDSFEQWYILHKIFRTRTNKDMILKNPLFVSYLKTSNKYLNDLNDMGFHLNLLDKRGYSIEDQRDFVEKNRMFILELELDDMRNHGKSITTFKTQAEVEQFIDDWNQLNELQRIINFSRCHHEIQYCEEKHTHCEIICREFVVIDKNRNKDPVKTVRGMLWGSYKKNYTNEEIEAYWIMHQLTK